MTDLSSYVVGRRGLSRHVIDHVPTEADIAGGDRALGHVSSALASRWPAGLAPTPIDDPDQDPQAPLPPSDYVVITWTAAELKALADVLTPGANPARRWHPYSRNFDTLQPTIRSGAPARSVKRLGSWHRTRVGDKTVLCMKSELHLNQDSISTGDGTATMPVAELFRQIIAEASPKLVITTGTAGGTMADCDLGDVVITRSAKFRLADEFRNASFNGQTYTSKGKIPHGQLATAASLLDVSAVHLKEPDFGPPTTRYTPVAPVPGYQNTPSILVEGVDFAAHHPILTTDYFEFGTSTNKLGDQGCGVEMGDAVLGLVADELGASAPRWLVVRNASDPPINGELPTSPHVPDMQAHWAVFYYDQFGYWTSVNSAIACWAVIAAD